MKAFIFKPSNEFITKFEAGSVEQLPDKLREFLRGATAVPPYSYVELSGRSWTIIGRDPLQLQDGIVKPAPSPLQSEVSPTVDRASQAITATTPSVQTRAKPGSLYVGIVTFVIIHFIALVIIMQNLDYMGTGTLAIIGIGTFIVWRKVAEMVRVLFFTETVTVSPASEHEIAPTSASSVALPEAVTARLAGKRFYVRSRQGPPYLGPFTSDEMTHQLARNQIDGTWCAIEACGQTEKALHRTPDQEWVPVATLLGVSDNAA